MGVIETLGPIALYVTPAIPEQQPTLFSKRTLGPRVFVIAAGREALSPPSVVATSRGEALELCVCVCVCVSVCMCVCELTLKLAWMTLD